jgi:uncharacterized membrane protein (DUF2068 family)
VCRLKGRTSRSITATKRDQRLNRIREARVKPRLFASMGRRRLTDVRNWRSMGTDRSQMQSNQPPRIPPVLQPPVKVKQRAPTLYAIIGFKLFKAILLLVAAFAMYVMRDVNFHEEFQRMQMELGLPATGFVAEAGNLLQGISPDMIRLFVVGMLLYGAFSLVEGIGLMFRAAWAGWMVIAESAVFVPLEGWEMAKHFSVFILVVLVLNVGIVWYLYANRHRLFRRAQGYPG